MTLQIDLQEVEVVVIVQMEAVRRLFDHIQSSTETFSKETTNLMQHFHLLLCLQPSPISKLSQQCLVCDLHKRHYNIMRSYALQLNIIVMDQQQLTVYLNSKCFDTCIDTFKHKLLTPTEKECMKICLRNMRGLYIEYSNGKARYDQSLKEAQVK